MENIHQAISSNLAKRLKISFAWGIIIIALLFTDLYGAPKEPVIINKEDLVWDPENGDLYSTYEGKRTQWVDKKSYWKIRMGGAGDWSKFRFSIPLAGTYTVKFKAADVPTNRGSIMDIIINGKKIGSYNHAGDGEEMYYGDIKLNAGENEVQFVVTGSNSGTYFYQHIAGFDFLPPGESVYGEHYGSKFTKEITGEPLGGGEGYSRTISVAEATYTVSTLEELEEALSAAFEAEDIHGMDANKDFIIYIDDNAEIDISRAKIPLKIPGNVTLASSRGVNGSLGGKIFTDVASPRGLFKTTGPNVRFTGLRIEGNDPDRHDELRSAYDLPLSQGIYSEYYMEVDNCEISAFSLAAIRTNNAYIHHNYLHHCQRKSLGYIIALDNMPKTDGFVLAEGNIFEKFRHAIAGMGANWERYEARYNTFKDGTLHTLDMHTKDEGRTLPKDGIYMAGHWIKIHHNTFYDGFMYYNEKQQERNRPHEIIYIRGVPFEGVFIDYNEFPDLNPEDGYLAMLQTNSYGNFFAGKNKYGPEGEIIKGRVHRSFNGKYPAPQFSLYNAVITNKSGQSIDKISEADGFINASAKVRNLNGLAEDIIFNVALKDKNGQVVKTGRIKRTLEPADAETIEIGFDLPADVRGYSIDIFIWNNIEDMYPLTDVISFE